MLFDSKKDNKSVINRYSFVYLLLACFTAAVGAGMWGYWKYTKFSITTNYHQPVQLIIPQHASVEKISKLLVEHKVINSAFDFKWMVRLKGYDQLIKAGEYLFPATRSSADVMQQIVAGKTVQYLMTIPEGLTSVECIKIINKAPFLVGSIQTVPPDGCLLPETYSYHYGETRQSVLKRMQSAMEQVIVRLWSQRSSGLILKTPAEVLTLASIIEKETHITTERPLIAAVFLNRLQLKIPLQSCPTVIYALQQMSPQTVIPTLTHADLKVVHPYNTYTIPALPPGPICNPSIASIEAVVHPAITNDLYFVANGYGGHVFARSLQQHQKNHQKLRLVRKQKTVSP